jgi:hypothetical protein
MFVAWPARGLFMDGEDLAATAHPGDSRAALPLPVDVNVDVAVVLQLTALALSNAVNMQRLVLGDGCARADTLSEVHPGVFRLGW